MDRPASSRLPSFIDTGKRELDNLVSGKAAELASGHFGIQIVLDKGKPTRIVYAIAETYQGAQVGA